MISNLKFKPSDFLTNFSVAEIVKQLKSNSGLICANGSMGGGGTGSGYGDSEKVRYRKHDSFSCHLKDPDKEKFNQAEIIQELKEKTESEILRHNAKVVNSNQLNSSSFYLEYKAENIAGRIEIKSTLRQENYFLIEVSFDETSTSQTTPIVERPLLIYQPIGNYHVVAFVSDDKEAREFYEKARRATEESNERFRQKVLAEEDSFRNFRDEDYRVVMYVWTRTPNHIKERLKDRFDGFIELSSEYDAFDKVYFLNDLALQMFREAGEKVKVVKTIEAEEVAKLLERPSFQSYYVPKEM
ncbi:MAG: hypothetical protein ACR2N3_12195 [Pyrinomonadaceae bacterium]